MDVTLTVLKVFHYRGRDFQPGDLVAMDPIDALTYQRYGFVGPHFSQTYQTRELTAK